MMQGGQVPANAPKAKACWLFRREEQNINRPSGLEVGLPQAFHSTDGSHYTQGAIIHAGMTNGITVRACDHCSCNANGQIMCYTTFAACSL